MRILYFGDVVGRSGRTAIHQHLPEIRESCNPDFVIVNGENAAHGFGITVKICREFFDSGIDAITLGNHSWDQPEIIEYIGSEPRLIRPLNYPENTSGKGAAVFETKQRGKVFLMQVMGRLFMSPNDDPFMAVDEKLSRVSLGEDVNCIVVDVHAEATSEKMALAHYLDGRVSMVIGSHTHVPTADSQILPGGTAYQTDAGMCGDYDSVIGMKKQVAIDRFAKKLSEERLEPAENEATVCGVFVETDDNNGHAVRISPLRFGGRLLSSKLD